MLTFLSGSVIVRACATSRLSSYGALVRAEFGRAGGAVLCGSIIVHVFGVMVVYLIIISDMLVGSAPAWGGILPYLLHRYDAPWFLTRWFVSGALVVVGVTPMLLPRDLTIVSRFSKLSVVMMLCLAGTLFGLAGVAVVKGQAADVHLLPSPAEMGGGGGVLGVLSSVLSVLAVLALAFTCQFNLVPVHNSLADNRTASMLSVLRHAIALCALLYGSLAVAGYTLFGSATEGDVLKNLTIKYAAGLVGQRPAEALVLFIVAANTLNLLVNFVLKVWAVRDSVVELALQRPAASLPQTQWYGLTAALVAASYGVSVVVPSVWFLVSLVGSTACVTFSYVFPGLLLRKAKTAGGRAAGAGAVALAAAMAATAVINTLSGNAEL